MDSFTTKQTLQRMASELNYLLSKQTALSEELLRFEELAKDIRLNLDSISNSAHGLYRRISDEFFKGEIEQAVAKGGVMGTEHYLICDDCKEFIDLHKRYAFDILLSAERPPIGNKDDCAGFGNKYWDARGVWFLWHHKDHGSRIRMNWDTNDDWYDVDRPNLKEVFPHEEDLKLRDS